MILQSNETTLNTSNMLTKEGNKSVSVMHTKQLFMGPGLYLDYHFEREVILDIDKPKRKLIISTILLEISLNRTKLNFYTCTMIFTIEQKQ